MFKVHFKLDCRIRYDPFVPSKLTIEHDQLEKKIHMGVSLNGGTPKSSILIGFSIINHPFWGTPIFGNTHIAIPHFGSF